MSWINSRSAAVAGLFALGVLTVPVMLLVHRYPLAARGAILAITLAVIWLANIYWKRLDEAARTAQQVAWFWGGSVGLGVGIVATLPPLGALWLPRDLEPLLMAPAGAMTAAGGAIAGFLVAWAVWWLRHR